MIPQQDRNFTISPGAILVENNTLPPDQLRLENDATGSGWAQVADHASVYQVDKQLAAAGWTFFYMATGTIRARAIGLEAQSMIHGALHRLFKAVKLQKCNCLEIDDIATRSFWGMRYVRISAHTRNIQKGTAFSGKDRVSG